MESAAPKAAPVDAPRISGADMGFLKMHWYDVPATERDAPTKTAMTTLGSLTIMSILFWTLVQKGSMGRIFEKIMPKHSLTLMSNLPKSRDKVAVTRRMMISSIITNKPVFLFSLSIKSEKSGAS